jgi:hypothetical protein
MPSQSRAESTGRRKKRPDAVPKASGDCHVPLVLRKDALSKHSEWVISEPSVAKLATWTGLTSGA